MLYSHVTLLMLRVVDVVAKTTVQQSDRMLVADIPGDIQIGALFPMHRQIAGAEGCGAIWEQYGIQRAEIAMLTVQELNKHLPFRLGISIRDSCWTERIAMEQTIAFLREGVTQCSCCQTAGCQKKTNPVVAIVGPAKSSTNIAVQNLLQVFRIPQIGYGATTTDLSDKEQFGYYLRVVPSDVWQAKAINQLLRHFNWTYIAVVYSAGNYGEKGFEALERLTHSPGIDVCIAHAQKVKSLANDQEFENILHSLLALKPRPQVVVCFCEGLSMKKLFKAQKNLRKKNPAMRTFQWIGSDGWADRLDVVEEVEEDATGSFSIRIHSPRVESFEPYYFSLNPINHTRNPWFQEFWQQKFKCQLVVPKDDTVTPVCTEKENLTMNYEQDAKLSQVINAVRVVGFALKAMYNDKCRNYNLYYTKNKLPKENFLDDKDFEDEDDYVTSNVENKYKNFKKSGILCPEMETINGTLLYKYMINVTFIDQFEQEISFDTNGDPPAWYDILNYVGSAKGFQLAGDFRQVRGGTHILKMTNEPKLFYDKSSVLPESVCSKPCTVGQRQRQTSVCCWICETCQEMQIVNYTTNMCQNCPLGFWPTINRTSCFALPHEYHLPTSIASLIALIFSGAGILLTLITVIIFIHYSSTPVVKSTTRELSFIILSGICASYMCTFVILARPYFATCFISRTLPPIAFSIVYSALLTKTNRIARILAGSKKRILTKKPKFLSTFSQVVITWILIGIQCVIVAVGVMEEMPQAGFEPHFMPKRMILVCTSSSLAFMTPFVWNFLLVLFCTLYAFKTRNLPENFNEAKFIGFTMYCTLVVWGAFVVLYFNSVNKALTMSYTFSLSASIALILLFFPKIFIIVLHPEKNVRSSYTTTKLIRCHFGNSQGTNDSKHLSIRTKTSLQSSILMSYGANSPVENSSFTPFQQSESALLRHNSNRNCISQYNIASTNMNKALSNTTFSLMQTQYMPHSRREVGTQTLENFLTKKRNSTTNKNSASCFTRTFSILGNKENNYNYNTNINKNNDNKSKFSNNVKPQVLRRKTLDDDVLQLIDSCKKYQDKQKNLHDAQLHRYYFDNKISKGENENTHYEDKVSQMLAGSIEHGVRTVFSTVSQTVALNFTKTSKAIEKPRQICFEELVKSTKEPLILLPNKTGSIENIKIGDNLKYEKNKIDQDLILSSFKNNSTTLKNKEKTDNVLSTPTLYATQSAKESSKAACLFEQKQQQYADNFFELLLRSRGIEALYLSNATQL